MHVLIVGRGKGSWQIRGEQLGAALGARVRPTVEPDDLAWADLVVLVKRAAYTWAAAVRQAGRPLVWDVLDCWAQPAQHRLPPTQARAWLAAQIRTIRPALTIAATPAMATACGGVYLPHHARPGLTPTDARLTIRTVAYDGSPVYLGRWRPSLEQACAARGWAFVVNPDDLGTADLIVAFRDGPWDGWICREWKSGVKAVNAIAAGRPLISQASDGGNASAGPGTVIEAPAALDAAFDAWTPYGPRQDAAAACRALAPGYRLKTIAGVYGRLLAGVLCPA